MKIILPVRGVSVHLSKLISVSNINWSSCFCSNSGHKNKNKNIIKWKQRVNFCLSLLLLDFSIAYASLFRFLFGNKLKNFARSLYINSINRDDFQLSLVALSANFVRSAKWKTLPSCRLCAHLYGSLFFISAMLRKHFYCSSRSRKGNELNIIARFENRTWKVLVVVKRRQQSSAGGERWGA